jgi:HEAT repeat protein
MRRRILIGLLAATLSTGAALAQDAPLGQAEQEAVVKLQSAKPDVRRDAAKKLGELKSRAAAPDLARAAASDTDPDVRRAAVVALGRIGDHARIPDMTAVLKDPNPKVRAGAVEGLVNLYLDRDAAFFTKVRTGVARVVPFWDEHQTAVVEPYIVVDPSVTTGLAELMRTDVEPANRVAAVRALGALRATSQVDALADAMAADTKLRPEVLDAFVLIGDPEAATYTIPFFESPDTDLAVQAMVTAGRLRAPKAVTPLLTAYGTGEPNRGIIGAVKGAFDPDRGKAAIQALALIGDPRAEGIFTAESNLYSKDRDVRRACYEGLAREGDPRFLPLVTRNSLIERDDDVRLAQSFALYKLKQPSTFGVIVNALRERSRRDQAASYVREANSVDDLMPYLRTPDKDAQRVVIEALGDLGDATTADALRPIVRGSSPEIALAADRSIRRIEWRLANRPAATPAPEATPAPVP